MQLRVEIDILVRCTRCGVDRAIEGTAERVLEGTRGLYADIPEPCEQCGSKRVYLEVVLNHGSKAQTRR